MKSKSLILALLTLGLQNLAQAQTCSSSNGVDLSRSGGAFAALPARDQGQLGTCYAHSGSDLISSYLKIGRINIYQTAVANDTAMSGGSPGDVISSFGKIGWACTNTSIFQNLFPSVKTNIIGELQDTFVGSPIFYSVNAFQKDGQARQKRIAELAATYAREKKVLSAERDQDTAINKYHALNRQIDALEDQIKKLEDKKSWFGSNEDIEKQIAAIKKKIVPLKKQSDIEHSKYVATLGQTNRNHNNLDALSEVEAAEAVYDSVGKQHAKFSAVMKKYGLSDYMPNLATFIVDRVAYDPKVQYSYAGIMYPFKIVKNVMGIICPAYEKVKIPALKGMSMNKRSHSTQNIEAKIDSLLETNRQAVSVSFQSSLLTGREGEHHAVNIIGCRTNGNLTEYLLQNSWGRGCSGYKASLQTKCKEGRIWVPSTSLMNSMTEINWVSK